MKPTTAKAKYPQGAQDIEILCRHESHWPPVHATLGHSFEEQRASGSITEIKYQQLKVWESMCGLQEMEPTKCLTCPLCETVHRKSRMSIQDFQRKANVVVEPK